MDSRGNSVMSPHSVLRWHLSAVGPNGAGRSGTRGPADLVTALTTATASHGASHGKRHGILDLYQGSRQRFTNGNKRVEMITTKPRSNELKLDMFATTIRMKKAATYPCPCC